QAAVGAEARVAAAFQLLFQPATFRDVVQARSWPGPGVGGQEPAVGADVEGADVGEREDGRPGVPPQVVQQDTPPVSGDPGAPPPGPVETEVIELTPGPRRRGGAGGAEAADAVVALLAGPARQAFRRQGQQFPVGPEGDFLRLSDRQTGQGATGSGVVQQD